MKIIYLKIYTFAMKIGKISWQYAHFEVTNAFMVTFSTFLGMYFNILAKACIIWLTFWAIFKR